MSDHITATVTSTAVFSPKDDMNRDLMTRQYPPPLATYLEVAQNVEVFMETLLSLHKWLGTKFKVPTLGGKPLDLHCLFVEVTTHGGLEKVIRDRKWKEIIATFNFPPTITNASFILRKYYLCLLHHYEQVYFFRNSQTTSATALRALKPETSPHKVETLPTQEENTDEQQIPENTPPLHKGSMLYGFVNGKFDYGFFVTMRYGSHEFNGILYHVRESQKTHTGCPNHLKRRRKRSRKDPSLPKSNRSGYNFFFAEHRVKLKNSMENEASVVKKIGELWNNLPDSEKAVYQEKGEKDKERYKLEMLEYKKSLNVS